LVAILNVVVYYLCSLGSLNKDRLVDLLVVGKPARVNKVFSFHPTARQHSCVRSSSAEASKGDERTERRQ